LVESAPLLFFSLELVLVLFDDGLVALSAAGLLVVPGLFDDLVFGDALTAGAGVNVAWAFVAGVIVAAVAGVDVAPVTGAALALVEAALLVVVPVVVVPVVVVPVVVADTPNVDGTVTP
jgi:hypothetical protein